MTNKTNVKWWETATTKLLISLLISCSSLTDMSRLKLKLCKDQEECARTLGWLFKLWPVQGRYTGSESGCLLELEGVGKSLLLQGKSGAFSTRLFDIGAL